MFFLVLLGEGSIVLMVATGFIIKFFYSGKVLIMLLTIELYVVLLIVGLVNTSAPPVLYAPFFALVVGEACLGLSALIKLLRYKGGAQLYLA